MESLEIKKEKDLLWKEYKKIERSFQGKLSTALTKLFDKKDLQDIKIRGYFNGCFFDSKETGYTFFRYSSSIELNNLVFTGQMLKQVPEFVKVKELEILSTLKVYRDLYDKAMLDLDYVNRMLALNKL